jgi:amino acid transporter
MVGGNPAHDAYGFRYWEDGRAFKALYENGDLGKFEGFLSCLWSAAFTVVGPEYISMVAAEAKRPRTYIKTAFKTVYFRFGLFFMGGALAVGIVCSSTSPALAHAVSGKGSGTAAASPYVIAMQRLNISVFPSIVNA